MAQRKRRRGRHARTQINTKNRGARTRGNQTTRSLGFEPLEDRRLLAVYLVNDLGDFDGDGNVIAGSLRNAIDQANTNPGFDTILFSDSLFSGPGSGAIFLDGREEGGQLELTDTDGIQILGPGAGVLTVFAPGGNRIFFIDDGNDEVRASAAISGITLSGGSPVGDDVDGLGGAILNRDALTLTEVQIQNSSAIGGGAIFNDVGASLLVDRSLIRDNFSSAGGGGIQNGIAGEEEELATTTILNSTITGNTASGPKENEAGYGGGGVLNLSGTVNIDQSTIVGNSAGNSEGGGVANQGFDPMLDGDMEPAVMSGFARMNIRSSIIVGNLVADAPNDVGSLGVYEGEEGEDVPFDPEINSNGFNLFGALTHPMMTSNPDIILPPLGTGDMIGITAVGVFIDDGDEENPMPVLADYGGVLPVFMPDINKPDGQMAIDGGDPIIVIGSYDQRGPQFRRASDPTDPLNSAAIMDIGAAEV